MTLNHTAVLQKATHNAAAENKERIETKRSPEALDRQIKQITRLLATEQDRLVVVWTSWRGEMLRLQVTC